MIQITADTRRAVVTNKEDLTVGSAGIQVGFTLSEDWDGLSKLAVFRVGDEGTKVDVALGIDLTCVVPPEVLLDEGEPLFIGIYGANESGSIIIPTIWASAGVVKPGTEPNTPASAEPTPVIWAQILGVATDAEQTAADAMSNVEAGLQELSAFENTVQNAEDQRQANEQVRIANEAERVAAETERSSAENSREVAEAARESNEATRQVTEQRRSNYETSWAWERDNFMRDGVSADTLPAGSDATATRYLIGQAWPGTEIPSASTIGSIKFGIPKGDTGEKGDQGDPGDDGVSPTVTITDITGGHRVTITDADHPLGQSFDVMDGQDGASDAGEVTYDETATYPSGSIGAALTDQKNAISKTDNLLEVYYKEGNGTQATAYTVTTLVADIILKAGETYTSTVSIENIQTAVIYCYLKDSNNTNLITFNIEVGNLIGTATYTPQQNMSGCKLVFQCGVANVAAYGKIEKTTNKIDALSNDISTLYDDVDTLSSKLEDISESLVEESENKYNPALQTPDTISPHYYVNGVPYSTTQFDTSYNCTALIPIKPNTTYIVGLVPAYNGIVNPWNLAANMGWSYDKDGNYISGSDWTSNKFTTPANAAYIRFNYNIGSDNVTLSRLNSCCVLVEGETLPESYIPYYKKTIGQRVASIEGNMLQFNIDEDKISILLGYGENNLLVTLEKHGGNDLFDYSGFYTVNKEIDIDSITPADMTTIQTISTDWHSPFQVSATDNIDGDNINPDTGSYFTYFTGGNHQYNNTGSGSTPTARTTTLEFLADSHTVTSGDSGTANEIEIRWTNLVQGYNTTRVDGTGREILQENHVIKVTGHHFREFVELIALESIVIRIWYGLQTTNPNAYSKVKYIGATNRGEYATNTASDCGDKTTNGIIISGANDVITMMIDTNVDLGKRAYLAGANYSFFTSAYGKSYADIIYLGNLALNRQDSAFIAGSYDFTSN